MELDVNKDLRKFFKEVLENKKCCSEVADETGISYCQILTLFSKYLVELKWELKGNPERIKAVIKLPDEEVLVFNGENRTMVELSGKYSKRLFNKIKKLADERTKWSGFD